MTNSTDAHRRLPAAIAMAIAFAVLAVAAPAAGAAEGRCANAVQGEIAWNYTGSTSWAEANVNRLCEGAEDSVEPARCFDRVMHGGVSRGASTRWEWADALDLCRGTLDAEATISCFEKRLAARMPWSPPILLPLRPSGATTGRAATSPSGTPACTRWSSTTGRSSSSRAAPTGATATSFSQYSDGLHRRVIDHFDDGDA